MVQECIIVAGVTSRIWEEGPLESMPAVKLHAYGTIAVCMHVIVVMLKVELLMLRCPVANFENLLFRISEKVKAKNRPAGGNGIVAGNS
eukprot:883242-Ditylum_brightwellii.AAC.1